VRPTSQGSVAKPSKSSGSLNKLNGNRTELHARVNDDAHPATSKESIKAAAVVKAGGMPSSKSREALSSSSVVPSGSASGSLHSVVISQHPSVDALKLHAMKYEDELIDETELQRFNNPSSTFDLIRSLWRVYCMLPATVEKNGFIRRLYEDWLAIDTGIALQRVNPASRYVNCITVYDRRLNRVRMQMVEERWYLTQRWTKRCSRRPLYSSRCRRSQRNLLRLQYAVRLLRYPLLSTHQRPSNNPPTRSVLPWHCSYLCECVSWVCVCRVICLPALLSLKVHSVARLL